MHVCGAPGNACTADYISVSSLYICSYGNLCSYCKDFDLV